MDVLDQKMNGYSLADCAEIMRMHTKLKVEHGERDYKGPWQEFLRMKGLTEGNWAQVWNAWHQKMEADPGLAAKYHTYFANANVRDMTAGQANVSQDALEGVTLEQFAKISAKIQGGGDAAALVAAEGLSMDQWLAGQGAWGQKMGTISPTDPIMLQYGQLYQKYNSTIPQAGGGAVSMEQAVEQTLDKHAQIQGNRSIDVTLQNAESEFFSSNIVRHKARGVRAILNLWDRSWDDRARNPALKQVTRRAYEISIDLLENGPGNGPGAGPGYAGVSGSTDSMDIHKWSDVHTEEEAYEDTVSTILSEFKDLAAGQFMTPAESDRAQAAIRKAIQRLTPRKAKVEELWSGTTDMTKKASLRSLLDSYIEVLDEMQEALDDWSYEGPESADSSDSSDEHDAPSPQSFQSNSSNQPSTAMASSNQDSPLIAFLKGLPIIGQILKALGL